MTGEFAVSMKWLSWKLFTENSVERSSESFFIFWWSVLAAKNFTSCRGDCKSPMEISHADWRSLQSESHEALQHYYLGLHELHEPRICLHDIRWVRVERNHRILHFLDGVRMSG